VRTHSASAASPSLQTGPPPAGVNLRWVAEYHGPNPLAPGAVVVATLDAGAVPEPTTVARTAAVLWQESRLGEPDGPPMAIDQTDGLLALAHAAVF
jgi:hypothetical protein